MKHQEKKYRVDSFAKIERILKEIGAKNGKTVVSTHYYAQQQGNDVVKLVEIRDRYEIHILEESNGKFALKEKIQVENKKAGLFWLQNKGYTTVDIVRMENTDYEYKGGVVGLYIIDDFLHSVILDFPSKLCITVEKELGLETAEVISAPYNKFLEQIGRLRSMKLS